MTNDINLVQSLCNACGIRFKKEERRATARNSITSVGGSSAAETPVENPYNGNYYSHHHYASSSPSWAHQNTQRVPYFSPAPEMEYPYVDDVTAASFLSWNWRHAARDRLRSPCPPFWRDEEETLAMDMHDDDDERSCHRFSPKVNQCWSNSLYIVFIYLFISYLDSIYLCFLFMTFWKLYIRTVL